MCASLWKAMLHCVRGISCLALIACDRAGWSACHQWARCLTKHAEQGQAISVHLRCSRLMLMVGDKQPARELACIH